MLTYKVNSIKTRWVADYNWFCLPEVEAYIMLSIWEWILFPKPENPFLSPLLINMIFKLCTMLTEPAKHLTATSMHLQVYE